MRAISASTGSAPASPRGRCLIGHGRHPKLAPMATRTQPRHDRLLRFGDTSIWIVFVVVLAICGAGLILTFDHPQNDAGRPELTARGDSLVGPRLAALEPTAAQLSADANAISRQARTLYGHVRARDTDAVRADVTAGDQLVAQAAADLAPLDSARGGLIDGTAMGAISQRKPRRGPGHQRGCHGGRAAGRRLDRDHDGRDARRRPDRCARAARRGGARRDRARARCRLRRRAPAARDGEDGARPGDHGRRQRRHAEPGCQHPSLADRPERRATTRH